MLIITGNKLKQGQWGQMNFITSSVVIVKPRSLSFLKTSGSNYAMPFYTVASGPRWLTCLRTLINSKVGSEAEIEKQHSK